MRNIQLAISSYQAYYGCLPFPANTSREIENTLLVAVLMGKTNDVQVARVNPKGIQFLTVADSSLKGGEFIDSWGHPYHILFEAEGSRRAVSEIRRESTSIEIWSAGPNGIDERGNGDDVRSVHGHGGFTIK
jgi:hypothetical protein